MYIHINVCICMYVRVQVEIPTGLPLVYDTVTRRIRLLEDGGVSVTHLYTLSYKLSPSLPYPTIFLSFLLFHSLFHISLVFLTSPCFCLLYPALHCSNIKIGCPVHSYLVLSLIFIVRLILPARSCSNLPHSVLFWPALCSILSSFSLPFTILPI